jgi:uncharacterized protein (TIRG00374 family)
MTDEARPPRPQRDALRGRAQAEGVAPLASQAVDDEEEMPRVQITRRALLLGIVFVISIVALFYFVLPQISGLDDTWHRIEEGDPLWLVLAGIFTILSFGGYVLLFQSVYVRGGCQLNVAESYQITMASLAATRLLAAGGAGGIALTAWALRRAGMPRRVVADQTLAFLVLTYAVYMAALVIGGFGLYFGIFHGPDDFAITVVPAIFALIAMLLALLSSLTPTDLQQRLEGQARHGGRLARLTQRAANLPASISAGVRIAIAHVRDRDPALVGSVAYWGFNIAILWASFRAFGQSPPWAVIVMAYFVGMLGNLLPLPGGVGGVDGGMIGAFAAFGVNSSLALVAVLTYRAFAFWLPTIPGAIAYFQLRRTVARWRDERQAERQSAVEPARA